MGDTPPPPYEETATDQGREPHVTTGRPPTSTARLLPLDFNVYSESATSGNVYYMGPHRKDRQFALTLHANSFREMPKPFLVLHDGLTRQDPAIGTSANAWVEGSRKFHDAYIITIPPYSGGSGSGLAPVQERLSAVDKGTYWHPVIALRYSIQVAATAYNGSGVSGERKDFEWQESTSPEVLMLGGESHGWRLVALADESETLAVCAGNGGSLTKFFRFSFKGKGRMTDYYGPTWEVMAVLTGLSTWCRKIEIANR